MTEIITVNAQERRLSAIQQIELSKSNFELVQMALSQVMREGEDYGKIPGCGDKPALLKPGAEKLCAIARLVPEFEVTEEELVHPLGIPGHREYLVRTRLVNANTGEFVGSGVGSCSTMESKYRYRGASAELTDKPVPKEYWDFWKSNPAKAQELLGGKGFSVKKNDTGAWMIAIKGEKGENEDPADQYNTCLKMAKKRSLVDATISTLSASNMFTQDIDEQEPTTAPQNPSTESAPTKANAFISEAQRKRFYAIYKKAGKSDDSVRAYLALLGLVDDKGQGSTSMITPDLYDELCKWAEAPTEAQG